jgi:hypothetical protein
MQHIRSFALQEQGGISPNITIRDTIPNRCLKMEKLCRRNAFAVKRSISASEGNVLRAVEKEDLDQIRKVLQYMRYSMLLLIPRRPYLAAFAFGKQANDSCVVGEILSDDFLLSLGQLDCKEDLVCQDRMPAEGYCEYSMVHNGGLRQHVLPSFHPTKLLGYCRLG